MLPPHVIISGVERSTHIYFLAAATPTFARFLARMNLVCEDLVINNAPIPAAACAIDPSAAAGVTSRLTREAARLRNCLTPTAVPMPVRVALAMTLRALTRAITQRPSRLRPHVPPFTPLSNALPTSATAAAPYKLRTQQAPTCSSGPRPAPPCRPALEPTPTAAASIAPSTVLRPMPPQALAIPHNADWSPSSPLEASDRSTVPPSST